jgi:hypothetical protein
MRSNVRVVNSNSTGYRIQDTLFTHYENNYDLSVNPSNFHLKISVTSQKLSFFSPLDTVFVKDIYFKSIQEITKTQASAM